MTPTSSNVHPNFPSVATTCTQRNGARASGKSGDFRGPTGTRCPKRSVTYCFFILFPGFESRPLRQLFLMLTLWSALYFRQLRRPHCRSTGKLLANSGDSGGRPTPSCLPDGYTGSGERSIARRIVSTSASVAPFVQAAYVLSMVCTLCPSSLATSRMIRKPTEWPLQC